MKCKCCNIREADKKNTHYLTDAIIRKCLNHGGTNYREKGFMFGFSNRSPFIEFSFQRETKDTAVKDALGREPTDEEIEAAGMNAFSVNYHFCSNCEQCFGVIENEFIAVLLPRFRGVNFQKENTRKIQLEEAILARKFFLLQFWRTSVCDPEFNLPDTLRNKLHKGIFYDNYVLKQIPLRVTHLNTIGDDFEYTKNLVGILVERSNFVILFNDFILQAFESKENINYIELYGLNEKESFSELFNVNETYFEIDILFNQERQSFPLKLYERDFVKKALNSYQELFVRLFYERYGIDPDPKVVASFVEGIMCGKDTTEEKRYSAERIKEYISNYFI